MKFLAPWLLTFAFGFGVYVVGRFLQRREKERRELTKEMRKERKEMEDMASIYTAAYSAPRQPDDVLAKYGKKEQQGKVGRFTQ
jgi:hypothetical protein